MKNVQGSSAGAGSGEFHVYKQSRRREYERLKLMDEEEAYVRFSLFLSPFGLLRLNTLHFCSTQTKEKKDALDRQREAQEATESKTAKNRLKRQKRKAARSKSGAKDDEDGSADSDQDKAGVEEKKRKLGGGGMMRFKTAEERAAEDEAENGVQESEGPNEGEEVEPVVEEVAPAKEAGIFIRDED